ncbi:MAG: cytosine deaminase, partial [Elusimicrobia bacterium CG_4_10_14_3_um_filter_49_12_50_7]
MELLIRNAQLRKRKGLVDIAVDKGKIVKIAKGIKEEAAKVIDAGGNLVTEAFCNAHLHLC